MNRATTPWMGCVLYELLAGVQAFPADARQPELARRGELVPVEDLAPDLAPHLAVAVAVALSAEPEGRPRTARELAALWSGADEPSAPRPLTEAGRPSEEASKKGRMPAGARLVVTHDPIGGSSFGLVPGKTRENEDALADALAAFENDDD